MYNIRLCDKDLPGICIYLVMGWTNLSGSKFSKLTQMDNYVIRIAAIIAHVLLNIVIISFLTDFDITARWITTIAFVLIIFLLFVMLIKHIVSFINYIKTKTK
jgi:hypothetical protein